ncbi:MAG: hypothetical protein ACRCY4_00550, partial [Brevinema sp.]
LSIILGLILALYFGIRLVVKLISPKQKPIQNEEVLLFSLFASGSVTIAITVVIGTSFPHALWIIWLGFMRLIFNLYKERNTFVRLFLPTGFLILFIGSFLILQDKTNAIRDLKDFKIAEYFQKLEAQGITEVEITAEELSSINIGIHLP